MLVVRSEGGLTEILVLPSGRSLTTTRGDAFEVSDEEAEGLLADPAKRFSLPGGED